jgi:phage terminase large subunit GpA-like protein
VVTCGVDVQETWIEAAVWAHGAGEEMWLLDTPQFHGDVNTDVPWSQLQDFLRTTYKTTNGYQVPISITAIDSGDQTELVYRKAKEFTKAGLKIVAIKGFDGARAVFEWSRYKNVGKPRLGLVGSSQAKGILLGRLKNVSVFGPGYIHFPAGVLPDVLEQITSEQKIRIFGKGSAPQTIWKKLRARNEQLDCMVYAYAALHSYKDILTQLTALTEKYKTILPPVTIDEEGKPIIASGPVVRPRQVPLPRAFGHKPGFNPWKRNS